MTTEPASIRSNNPGAMWGKGNPIATKWGATSTEALADGLGQGNNIAHFPTPVAGAAAQFDLWRMHYTGLTLKAAILKWSGGNWSQPYADFLVSHTKIALTDNVSSTLLASGQGLALMKYQAQWEAGKPYPLTDDQWAQAQAMVFAVVTTVPKTGKPAPMLIELLSDSPITVKINGKEIS